MRGKIVEVNFDSSKAYGLIEGRDGKIYHFSEGGLLKEASMEDFYVEDEVSFSIRKNELKYDHAVHVKLEVHTDKSLIAGYATPGLSKRLNLKVAEQEHLKGNSGESELIRFLSKILMITYVGHYAMDQSSIYPFCLASASTYFKQFIRETGEFLIIFSHFDNEDWQQKTLKVENELRKRRDLLD